MNHSTSLGERSYTFASFDVMLSAACLHFLVASYRNFAADTFVFRNDIATGSMLTQYTFSLFAVIQFSFGCGWGSYPSGGPEVRSVE